MDVDENSDQDVNLSLRWVGHHRHLLEPLVHVQKVPKSNEFAQMAILTCSTSQANFNMAGNSLMYSPAIDALSTLVPGC